MHFHTRPEWPAAELAEQMGVAPDALRRKIIYWINQGKARLGIRHAKAPVASPPLQEVPTVQGVSPCASDLFLRPPPTHTQAC